MSSLANKKKRLLEEREKTGNLEKHVVEKIDKVREKLEHAQERLKQACPAPQPKPATS